MPYKPIKKQQPRLGPILLILIGLILLVATLAMFLLSRANERLSTTVTLVPIEQVTRLTPADAFTNLGSDDVVFLDVRSRASYAQMHIPGAVNIPLAEIETAMSQLDKSEWIITYCT